MGRERDRSVLIDRVKAFSRDHWRAALKVQEWLKAHEESTHLLLACTIGIAGGVINLLFTGAIDLISGIYIEDGQTQIDFARSIGWKLALIIPVSGGLLAGLILFWRNREKKRGELTNNLLEAVATGNGKLSFRYALKSSLSSLSSIMSGASLGREGAITQMGAAFASALGQKFNWPPYRLRLMVASGAAAGMAAAYNAPISGSVFAAQIVLGNFSMRLLAPILFSAVMASVISRSFLRVGPMFEVPVFEFNDMTQLPYFVLLGLTTGLAGALFLAFMQTCRKGFDKTGLPIYIRVPLGGLLVGLIAIYFPEVIGNGYTVTNELFRWGEISLVLAAGLFAAKFLATGISVASGAVGGVFTPTLLMGASVGIFFSRVFHGISLADPTHVAAFALAGMCGILAATTHSALLAIIMVFELSLNYSIMPALMVTTAVSTLVSRRFYPQSVYTNDLDMVGLEEKRESTDIGASGEQSIGDWISHPKHVIRQNSRFEEIVDVFLGHPIEHLTVVDRDGILVGEVQLEDLKGWLNEGTGLEAVIAMDIMRPSPQFLTAEMRLSQALPLLLTIPNRYVPVVNNRFEKKLIGTLSRTEVLSHFSDMISNQSQPGINLFRNSSSKPHKPDPQKDSGRSS